MKLLSTLFHINIAYLLLGSFDVSLSKVIGSIQTWVYLVNAVIGIRIAIHYNGQYKEVRPKTQPMLDAELSRPTEFPQLTPEMKLSLLLHRLGLAFQIGILLKVVMSEVFGRGSLLSSGWGMEMVFSTIGFATGIGAWLFCRKFVGRYSG